MHSGREAINDEGSLINFHRGSIFRRNENQAKMKEREPMERDELPH